MEIYFHCLFYIIGNFNINYFIKLLYQPNKFFF